MERSQVRALPAQPFYMKIRFFDIAKKLAAKSNHHQHKLGCVLVKKNRIVGVGFNKIRTHTKSVAEYNMLHAEISALFSAQDAEDCIAYVYRETKTGIRALAKPCEGCHKALKLAGVKTVYYTSDNSYSVINL